MRTTGSHADQWRRLCFAQPPAVGKRSTAGGTDPRFRSQVNASRPVNPPQNATSGNGSLRNASKCSETFRNALARMNYCLGLPSPPPMDPLVTGIPSANLCKILHNFVDICIRKQKFAELTPVHLWMTPTWQELFRRYSIWSSRSSVRPHGADHVSRGP